MVFAALTRCIVVDWRPVGGCAAGKEVNASARDDCAVAEWLEISPSLPQAEK